MKEQKKSPWHVLGNLDLYFMVILLACLIVLTVGGVLKRYILRNPISWLEEIQALLFMWITFIGGSAAFRYASHVSIEILVDSLPKKIGGLIERFDVLLQLLILGLSGIYLLFPADLHRKGHQPAAHPIQRGISGTAYRRCADAGVHVVGVLSAVCEGR